MSEVYWAALLCNLLQGGEAEVRHSFPNIGDTRHIRIDCETRDHVFEIGLDGRASARDSVHQALFASLLTGGKQPMVVVIDRDGVEDRYQYELRRVAALAGVGFAVCKADFIAAWSASRGMRAPVAGHDLPSDGVAERHCDLSRALKR